MTMQRIDPKVPPSLLSIQKRFARIITSPTGEGAMEAQEFIAPSHNLSSKQRIQIYNEQYWRRIFSVLHETFPILVRIFGYEDFNRLLALPFLTIYSSRHWSIDQLGKNFPSWINEYYTAQDKSLVFFTAVLDWEFQELSCASPPDASLFHSADVMTKKLALQSHVKLFKLPFDLYTFREALLKEKPEFWEKEPFPVLSKGTSYFFLLYRLPYSKVIYKKIDEGEWTFLNLISKGLTIEEACDELQKKGGKPCEEAEASLAMWIQEWICNKYFFHKKI